MVAIDCVQVIIWMQNVHPFIRKLRSGHHLYTAVVMETEDQTNTQSTIVAGVNKQSSSTNEPKQDTLNIEDNEPNKSHTPWIPLICIQSLIYFHRVPIACIFLVIPFYVASTPEHGWTVSNLSIIFALFFIGGIVASQICMVAELSATNRNTILFIGHLSQFVLGIVGFMMMSSVFGFNLFMFYVASFLVGFSSDFTTIEPYGALISDDESVQLKVLGSIGKMLLFAGVVNAFLLTAIYDNFGFLIFCVALCILYVLAIVTLCILWSFILRRNKKLDESNTGGKRRSRSSWGGKTLTSGTRMSEMKGTELLQYVN